MTSDFCIYNKPLAVYPIPQSRVNMFHNNISLIFYVFHRHVDLTLHQHAASFCSKYNFLSSIKWSNKYGGKEVRLYFSRSHSATQHLPSAEDPTGPADASDSQWWYTQQEAKRDSGLFMQQDKSLMHRNFWCTDRIIKTARHIHREYMIGCMGTFNDNTELYIHISGVSVG